MPDRLRPIPIAGLALLAALLQLPVGAQEPPLQPGDEIGWHVVRPGETLEGVTDHYLGDPKLWRDNWRLNPDVENPHVLVPGQRIRVYLSRHVRAAEITAIARSVDQKPYPEPWLPARIGDRLKERDGVRTHKSSSTELAFEDQSVLRVGEQSVVFLRDTGSRLQGVSRKSLEILEGQADVEARPAAALPSDLEILIEGARASARPSENDPSRARARRNAAGSAQLMVFSGSGQVAAGGEAVEVPRGMGTSVPKGGRPAPPEKLLPAPRPWRPRDREVLDHANPRLSWDPVPGAASYTLEICRDTACGQLVLRLVELTSPEGAPDQLPLGDLYWRVSAVSPSGLDGFRSEPRVISIRSLWRKPHPRRQTAGEREAGAP